MYNKWKPARNISIFQFFIIGVSGSNNIFLLFVAVRERLDINSKVCYHQDLLG